jgi:hypothetical protein
MGNSVFKINPSLVTILLCERSVTIISVNEDIELSFWWGENVANLTLGLRLSVKCKGPWGKGQGMKPNNSQVHTRFGSCVHTKVTNV